MSGTATACPSCLSRVWLLGRLAGNLDVVRHRIPELLALEDDALVDAVAGADRATVRAELSAFDPVGYAADCAAAGLELICRCDAAYPFPLRALQTPPAVLHVAGGRDRFRVLARETGVAVVGARRATPYGLEMSRSLGRGLAAAGITVVSGLARGVDAAAHEGALGAGARTLAVLGAAPQRPYPGGLHWLHTRVLAGAAAVSELGPGVPTRRWMFLARNRIIAGLAEMTIVVAARERSGAMVTARQAAQLGRVIGAVPGQARSPLSSGPHRLLRDGACLVTGVDDVLDALFGATARRPPPAAQPGVEERLRPLLEALADGFTASQAFADAALEPAQGLAALAELELAGHIRRESGGRFTTLR